MCHAQSSRDFSAGGYSTAEAIDKIMDIGYGSMCSLTYEVSEKERYYRCFDIGPYRFVKTYSGVQGFVLSPGNLPFHIMHIENGKVVYLYQGSWTTDLESRVGRWWFDEIGGGRDKVEKANESSKKIRDADDAVRGFQTPSISNSPPVVQPSDVKSGTPPNTGERFQGNVVVPTMNDNNIDLGNGRLLAPGVIAK